MWRIKYIDKKTNNTKTIKKSFDSQDEANNYIAIHMKDTEGVWPEESIDTEGIDLTTKIGSWLWLYSNKKKEFFPYGRLMNVTAQFAKIKTKADQEHEEDFSDMRVSRIKEMFETKKLQINIEGDFVNLKEYI